MQGAGAGAGAAAPVSPAQGQPGAGPRAGGDAPAAAAGQAAGTGKAAAQRTGVAPGSPAVAARGPAAANQPAAAQGAPGRAAAAQGPGRQAGRGGAGAAGAAAAAAAASPAPKVIETRPIAGPARIEHRHRGLALTFIAVVLVPTFLSLAYLWIFARDQYSSTVAFSIRKEQYQSSLDLLGGISKLSGASGSDADVLYEFIRSQELVERVNRKLDLVTLYSKAWPRDPVFAYNPSGTIEDLQKQWEQSVKITYDTSSGLISLQVLAFDPEDAQRIAAEILEESTKMINDLSNEAREDATRYARDEMERSVERLKQARGDVTEFRLRNQLVDPQADLQGQMGVLNTLQEQLAASLIELDLLIASARADDPRITQAQRRIDVIESRITQERQKFAKGGQGPGGEDYVTLMAEYERLSVDRQFAEESYRAALVAYDAALAEAQRKSRYLAAHIQPTLAERSEYPQRWTLSGMTFFFLLMAWSIGVLIYYSVRDRR